MSDEKPGIVKFITAKEAQERFDASKKVTTPKLQLLTVAEVAGILQVSKRTVHRMVDDRMLSACKIRTLLRIPAASVAAYIGRAIREYEYFNDPADF